MFVALLWSVAIAGDPAENTPPEGWVDLDTIPGLSFDIRYHTADNFTGAPLPGYGVPAAWLRKAPAEALARVQARLAERGLTLKIYDAYRPRRGTQAMVAWAERTGQTHLLDEGYVARVSGHNRGHTMNLSVVDRATGRELDMGTPWDTLTAASHTKNATGTALENRLLLKTAMEAEGWKAYFKEWWHFTYPPEGTPPTRDVPYACWEPAEGTWTAPAGWNAAGWSAPATTPTACPE